MNTYRFHRLAMGAAASALLFGCPSDDSSNDSGAGTGTGGMTAASMSGGMTGADDGSGSMSGGMTGADSSSDGGSMTTMTTTPGDGSSSSSGGAEGSSSSSGGSSSSSSGGVAEACMAPGELIPCDSLDEDPSAFQAMGLNCAGGANEAIPIINGSVTFDDDASLRIATQFGDFIDPGTMQPIWSPREGEQFVILSSGRIDAPDAAGSIVMAPDSHETGFNNINEDNKPLPAPMSPFNGSNGGAGGTPFLNCDGINDCSDTILDQWNQGGGAANDLVWGQFGVIVPGGTHGFSFDFAYFSAEFPEWVGTTFNDIFAIWSTSETYTGNLCFVNDQPCTVTALWPVTYTANAPELDGTGFDATFTDSGGTGWFQAKGSAEPYEQLQIAFAVFDMGDSVWDTAVIMDNFQWDCEGCIPTEVEPCVGIDPV